VRRPVALIAVALAALPLAGCGGTSSPAQQKRVDFLNRYAELDDQELARLCPSLFPTDYLERPKHYHYTRNKKTFQPTARQRADARTAGCTSQGTKPKD
jgi:hypothetical protein